MVVCGFMYVSRRHVEMSPRFSTYCRSLPLTGFEGLAEDRKARRDHCDPWTDRSNGCYRLALI